MELQRRRNQLQWSQSKLADSIREAAVAAGLAPPPVSEGTVGRWERGERRPGAYYTRLLCAVFEVSAAELGLHRKSAVPADSDDLGPEDETFDLARAATAGLDESSVAAAHLAAHRLCRDYSGTRPAELRPRIQKQLRQLNSLLTSRVGLAHQRQLLTDAAWLYLLLAAVHNDLGQRDAAWASRNAAFALGGEVGDGNVIAWSLETPAWFAMSDRRAVDALDAAAQGLLVAPEGSSGWIMNQLKRVQGYALLGDRRSAERDLDKARQVLERMPEPEYPDHHFAFDGDKLPFYAATAYAWLKMPKRAEEEARRVIRTAGDRHGRSWVPTRRAYAWLDLANALIYQDRLDEASAAGSEAFRIFLRRDTLVRADELAELFRERYPNARETQLFDEEVEAAAATLGLPRSA